MKLLKNNDMIIFTYLLIISFQVSVVLATSVDKTEESQKILEDSVEKLLTQLRKEPLMW